MTALSIQGSRFLGKARRMAPLHWSPEFPPAVARGPHEGASMSSNGRIDYYFWHMSDWAYFGHPRLEQLADRQGVSIDYMPVDLPYVYTRTGGILLPLRAKERQDYRVFELKRFREQLGIPLNLEPKFFPVSGDLASCVTIAAKRRGLPLARLVPAMMRAVWAEDRDVSDAETAAA